MLWGCLKEELLCEPPLQTVRSGACHRGDLPDAKSSCLGRLKRTDHKMESHGLICSADRFSSVFSRVKNFLFSH